MTINRVKTGIEGLDELIQGGFPKGSLILISGAAGTGKSLLSLQFLCKNAKEGKAGVYVTLEESKESVMQAGERLKLNSKALEKDGKLSFLEYFKIEADEFRNSMRMIEGEIEKLDEEKKKLQTSGLSTEEVDKKIKEKRDVIKSIQEFMKEGRHYSQDKRERLFFNKLRNIVSKNKAEFLVIDSLSGYMLYDGTRESLHKFVQKLRDLGLTTLVVAELGEDGKYLAGCEHAEFMVDGVIKLVAMEGVGKRTITIKKLRFTKHEIIPKDMKITEKGIIIKST